MGKEKKVSWRAEFESARTLSSDKWDHYLDIYDHVLAPWYGSKVRFLEIGVQGGGSLEIARRLFGEGSWIGGVDIDPACARYEGPVADKMFIGSQVSSKVLKPLREAGPFDIVIDDGSHVQGHMVTTFINLFDRVAEGGVYIIEDTHTNYSPAHQKSFFGIGLYDYFKGLVERLNVDFMDAANRSARFKLPPQNRPAAERPDAGGLIHEIFAIEFYNSMIVVRKKSQPEPLRLRR
jgi:hypothetical protein